MTVKNASPRKRRPEAKEVEVAAEEQVDDGENLEGMEDLNTSLQEKVAAALAAAPIANIDLTGATANNVKGPLGNTDYIKPGSIQHLIALGFDESGNYSFDMSGVDRKTVDHIINQRLRWWHKARTQEDKVPDHVPPRWTPDADEDVESVN